MLADWPTLIGLGLCDCSAYLSFKYSGLSREERAKAKKILSQKKYRVEDLAEIGKKKSESASHSEFGVIDGCVKLMEKQIVCGFLNSSTPLKISKDQDDCLLVIEAENREAMAQSHAKRKLSSYIYSSLY